MDRTAISDQIDRILRSQSFAGKSQLRKLLEVLSKNMDSQATLKPDRVIKELWPQETGTKGSADVATEMNRPRQAGYDATEQSAGVTRHLQIKGRCLLPGSKPCQRLGSIDITKDWDAVLMVLLDENFDALEIYEAQRADILRALSAPSSKARNELGALAVRKFKSIARLRWSRRRP